MIALNRITRWALRAAARRWPADVRDEMAREWHAELADLEGRPGTALRRIGFAFSLLTSPPVRDASGVPRGWGGTRAAPGTGAGFALLGVALFGVAAWRLISQLAAPVLYDVIGFGWFSSLIEGVATALLVVPAGYWLGRRLPMSREGRFGVCTPAVLAPAALFPAVLSRGAFDPDLGLVVGALAWAVGTALLGWITVRAAVRSRRGLAGALTVAGVPLVAVVALALSTLPMVLTWPTGLAGGLRAASWSLLMDSEAIVMPEGVYSFAMVGGAVFVYTAYGWLAVVYGLRAAFAERKPAPVAVPAASKEGRPVLPLGALLAGLAAMAGGVAGWAYTVTVVTPDLPVWSADAPLPGGDGEIYLWAAELRWTAILLAALGLVVAAANRRSAVRGAVLLGAGLLIAESVLLGAEASGAGGMRVALIVAAVVTGVAWIAAGRPGPVTTVRRRSLVAAVAASACGPLLYFQSTPPENHEFMPPLGLPLTTVLLAATGVLLGTVTAVAHRRLHPVAAAGLIGVPLLVLAGFGPYLGNGSSEEGAMWGSFLALPLAVVVTGVLRRHRPRRRGRTLLIWSGLAVAGAVATVPLLYASFALLMVMPSMLFLIDRSSYPADGLSVVPGAAVLVIGAAMLATRREGGAPAKAAEPGPEPGPEPLPETAPPVAAQHPA